MQLYTHTLQILGAPLQALRAADEIDLFSPSYIVMPSLTSTQPSSSSSSSSSFPSLNTPDSSSPRKPLSSSSASAADAPHLVSLRARLRRMSPQRRRAAAAGCIRPFLLLVSMTPLQRWSYAVALKADSFLAATDGVVGDEHAEAYAILTHRTNGMRARFAAALYASDGGGGDNNNNNNNDNGDGGGGGEAVAAATAAAADADAAGADWHAMLQYYTQRAFVTAEAQRSMLAAAAASSSSSSSSWSPPPLTSLDAELVRARIVSPTARLAACCDPTSSGGFNHARFRESLLALSLLPNTYSIMFSFLSFFLPSVVASAEERLLRCVLLRMYRIVQQDSDDKASIDAALRGDDAHAIQMQLRACGFTDTTVLVCAVYEALVSHARACDGDIDSDDDDDDDADAVVLMLPDIYSTAHRSGGSGNDGGKKQRQSNGAYKGNGNVDGAAAARHARLRSGGGESSSLPLFGAALASGSLFAVSHMLYVLNVNIAARRARDVSDGVLWTLVGCACQRLRLACSNVHLADYYTADEVVLDD
jgi:hypothetical protein